jgi:TonB-linked SusC/RagA family outer membrane protein
MINNFTSLIYKLLRFSACIKASSLTKVFLSLLTICALSASISFAQSTVYPYLLKGKIVDVSNQPLPGVVITAKYAGKSTMADVNGNYSISVTSINEIIIVSYLGYETKQRPISGLKIIDFVLQESNVALNDVVVIGYGTQDRREVATSIASVSTKNANEGGYSNFQQLIGGRAPGVLVTETSGSEPGGGISIEIRGAGSLNFTTQPLYVVDGIPLETPQLNGLNNGNANAFVGNGSSPANPLSAINPNDIESIDILKDAAASAIYGSRGSNGVVLITTKSGKSGKTRISLNYNRSNSKPLKQVELLNAQEFATLANEAYRYRKEIIGNSTIPAQPFLESEIENLKTYDHQSELERSAPTSDLTLTVSGGDVKNKFYLSGQAFDQGGIVPNTHLKRYNGKINYEGVISSKLKLTSSVNLTRSTKRGQPISSIQNNALRWSPAAPLINEDGSFNNIGNFYYGDTYFFDPNLGPIYYNDRFTLSQALGSIIDANNPAIFTSDKGLQNFNTNFQLIGNLNLAYKLNNKFSFNGIYGLTMYSALLENYVPINLVLPFSTQRGAATLGNSQNLKSLYQLQANYNQKVKKHTFGAVLVSSAEMASSKVQTASSMGFTSDITGFNSIQSGSVVQTPNSNIFENQLISGVFRGTYSYNDKYYLNASGRADGSSKFAKGNQYGFFPSVGGAWRLGAEKFIKKLQIFDDLKIKASWGLVGNQFLDPYGSLSNLGVTSTSFGGVPQVGFSPSNLANQDLTWEKTSSANLGIDLSFFKSRLNFSAEVYSKNTKDLLFNVALPLTSGFNTMISNVASINNEGLELTLNTVNISTKNWKWTSNFNIAFNRNLVKELSGSAGDFLNLENVAGSAFLFKITPGQPIGQFFGYKTVGVWTDETILTKPASFQPGAQQGARKYEDTNGDNILNDLDRTYIGSALPKFFGGFSSNFSFKSFELSSFFSYSYGNKIFNLFETNVGLMNGFGNVKKSTFENRYRVIYSDTDPVLAEQYRANNATTKVMVAGTVLDGRESTDYFIEDGSYLRCRDITLKYSLPNKWIKSANLDNVRLYINLQNAFTITNYSGLNPEVNTGSGLARGVDSGTSPVGRTLRFGFTVDL